MPPQVNLSNFRRNFLRGDLYVKKKIYRIIKAVIAVQIRVPAGAVPVLSVVYAPTTNACFRTRHRVS